jgi:hypothetical protein
MKRLSFWPIVAFILLAIPVWMMAFPQPPAGNTGAPGDGTCSSCHSGVSTTGAVMVAFPSGTTYTPGVKQHLSVTVNDTTHSAWSFQLTARLATNTSSEAGSFTATDAANTIVVANGATQDMETTASGINQSTWSFDWTPPATNAGNVNVYVIGLGAGGSSGSATSGNGIYTASYVLTPAATADFSLSASPSALTLAPGASGTSTITVTPKNGFNSTVAFTASGLPAGVTASFSTSGLMTLSAGSSAAAGTSTVTITGTSGSLSHTATVALTVSPAAAPDFSLSASPSSISLAPGASGTSTITVTPVNGFSGTVAFAASGLPAGVSASFASGVMTLSASSTAAAGTSTVTVTGTSGSLSHSTTVSLTVTATNSATLAAAPSALSFAYQVGATAPPSQTIHVTTTGTVNYSVATSGGAWLSASPTSGNSSGAVTVSVNPASLASGTYNGTVTISAPGVTGSPQTVKVTLVVTDGPASSITVSPSELSFTSQGESSTGALAAQKLTITSSGGAVSYAVKETTQTGGNWLMVSASGGTTPGTLEVSVHPVGLTSGTYHGGIAITPSEAGASAQMVPITLTIGNPRTSSLHVTPTRLTFSSGGDDSAAAAVSKNIQVTSIGAAKAFSAVVSGGSWLTVSPTNATPPANLTVSVDAHDLSSGVYSGMITLTAGTQKASVRVTLYVAKSDGGGDDGSEGEARLTIQPSVNDPSNSNAVGVQWLDAAGVPSTEPAATNQSDQALVLAKTAGAPAAATAEAQIVPAESLAKLTELGFDIRQGSHCTATAPHFVVVTSDNVTHVLTGCANGSVQTPPAAGWIRVRFDPANPAQANPAITPDQQIKSIAVVLDQGPEATATPGGGLAVLDNIAVNGVVIGKD